MRPLTKILNAWSEPNFWEQPTMLRSSGTVGAKETIGSDFDDYVRQAYKKSGLVFSCLMVRQLVFSEARFQWRRFNNGRPGELFGTPDLSILERPWPNATTGELLSRMEQDASLAGNFYGVPVVDEHAARIRRLRPNWVTIVTGSPNDDPYDYRARPVGYIYHPKDRRYQSEPVFFPASDVVHYSPIPDPEAQWRGMSWLTPVINEVQADQAATKHKQKFFENGAVPGMTISYDPSITPEAFQEYVRLFEENHAGLDHAYKALHLGGGADPTTVGATPQQLDFKVTQGASETRIAAASGLGAVMAQFSEGLAGSSLNAGNFSAARKRSETVLFRPLWRMAASSLETIIANPPTGAHLWFDTRDIAFLRDDAKEESAIRKENAITVETLWRSGFTPESAVIAVTTGDFTQLEHTGVESVQTQTGEAV